MEDDVQASSLPEVNSRQLRAVLAVAEYRSFIAAAAFLKTSQPALTRTIKQIECACRKPKSERIGDAARRAGRATRCVPSAEPGERLKHPGPMTCAFAPYCNNERTLSGYDADAPRPARRCGPRTRDGSCQSTARQTNSAKASPLKSVCRGSP